MILDVKLEMDKNSLQSIMKVNLIKVRYFFISARGGFFCWPTSP